MEVKIEASWKEVLSTVFKSTYFLQTAAHIKTELATGANIFLQAMLFLMHSIKRHLTMLKWLY